MPAIKNVTDKVVLTYCEEYLKKFEEVLKFMKDNEVDWDFLKDYNNRGTVAYLQYRRIMGNSTEIMSNRFGKFVLSTVPDVRCPAREYLIENAEKLTTNEFEYALLKGHKNFLVTSENSVPMFLTVVDFEDYKTYSFQLQEMLRIKLKPNSQWYIMSIGR